MLDMNGAECTPPNLGNNEPKIICLKARLVCYYIGGTHNNAKQIISLRISNLC